MYILYKGYTSALNLYFAYIFSFQEYFIAPSVDIQEQVYHVQKLHHILEILVSCMPFIKSQHELLFSLTQ